MKKKDFWLGSVLFACLLVLILFLFVKKIFIAVLFSFAIGSLVALTSVYHKKIEKFLNLK